MGILWRYFALIVIFHISQIVFWGSYEYLIRYLVLISFSFTLFRESIYKRHLIPTVAGLILFLLVDALNDLYVFGDGGGYIVYVSGACFLFIYIVRFWSKPNDKDYILHTTKLIVVCYIISIFCFDEDKRPMTLGLLGLTYAIITFFTIKTSRMVRNIMIGVLVLVSVFLVVFSQIQLGYAEKERVRAMELERDAWQSSDEAGIKLELVRAQLDSCRQGLK